MTIHPSTIALLSGARAIVACKHPERLHTTLTVVAQHSREMDNHVVRKGVEARRKANDITSRHSGFENFDQLLNAQDSYRPTLEVSDHERLWLADYYDQQQELRGDPRRAYRYEHPETEEGTGLIAGIAGQGAFKESLRTYYVYATLGDPQVTQRKDATRGGLLSTVRARTKAAAQIAYYMQLLGAK